MSPPRSRRFPCGLGLACLVSSIAFAQTACVQGTLFEPTPPGSPLDRDQPPGDRDNGPQGDEDGTPNPGDTDPELPPEFQCPDPTAVPDPGPGLVRRLTVQEYINTVRAVTGVDIDAEARATLPADLRADGFSNTANALVVSLEHVEAYEALAEAIVAGIPDLPAFVDQHTSCREDTDPCRTELIDGFGTLAFRGPVTEAERTPLLALFVAAQAEGLTYDNAGALVLEAILQSPRFVYRVEDQSGGAGVRGVSALELASRISFLVIAGPPDATLKAVAEADALSSPAQIEAQVRRLLDDPRAKPASHRYFNDWLNLDRLENITRDTDRFPDFDRELALAMKAETLALFDRVVWQEPAPLTALFNAQQTTVSRRLAEHYGLANPQDGVSTYSLESEASRGGLLTHGSLLTIGGDDSSMVARGLFVLGTVLCGSVGDVPDGIDSTPGELGAGSTQRDHAEERVANPYCSSCHAQFEPLAYGLERFDATGSYSTLDRFGNDLREDGVMSFPEDEDEYAYQNVAELMDLLAGHERVRDCMTLNATQYAMGRSLLDSDGCSSQHIRDSFVNSSQTYHDLLVAIATSPKFRTIRTE